MCCIEESIVSEEGMIRVHVSSVMLSHGSLSRWSMIENGQFVKMVVCQDGLIIVMLSQKMHICVSRGAAMFSKRPLLELEHLSQAHSRI